MLVASLCAVRAQNVAFMAPSKSGIERRDERDLDAWGNHERVSADAERMPACAWRKMQPANPSNGKDADSGVAPSRAPVLEDSLT